MSIKGIGEIEREIAHLAPKQPQPHNAGLFGFAYGGIALSVYWLASDLIELPWVFAVPIALGVTYATARYDGKQAWRPYNQEERRLMLERTKTDA